MLDKIVHCFSLFSVMLLGRCCYCQCIFLSLLLIFLPRLLMLVLGAFVRWLSFFCWMLDIFVFSTKYVFHVPLMGGCFRGWGFFCPLCTWFFCAWFKSVFLLRSLYFAAIICRHFCVNFFLCSLFCWQEAVALVDVFESVTSITDFSGFWFVFHHWSWLVLLSMLW